MSQIRTDSIIPSAGLSSGATGGGIIQIYQDTSTAVESTTSSSYVDTSLSITLTPKATSSKFIIICSCQVSASGNTLGWWTLVRNSTEIFVGTSGVTGNATGCSGKGGGTYNSSEQFDVRNQTFVDSPGTTSSTTYKIQFKNTDGATTYFNRRAADSGLINVPSSLIIMEVNS